MVVPKLRQEYFSPVTNNKDFDTNYNYITAKPYSKQFNDTFTKSSNVRLVYLLRLFERNICQLHLLFLFSRDKRRYLFL